MFQSLATYSNCQPGYNQVFTYNIILIYNISAVVIISLVWYIPSNDEDRHSFSKSENSQATAYRITLGTCLWPWRSSQPLPKTIMVCTSGPNLAILAWMDDELWQRQARGWHTDSHTHTHTDAGNDNNQRSKVASSKLLYLLHGMKAHVHTWLQVYSPVVHLTYKVKVPSHAVL